MTFAKANFPSSCANHTTGFSGQEGGSRIPTRLSVKDEDEIGRLLRPCRKVCFFLRYVSRRCHQMWRYRYVFPNTRAHAQLHVLETLIPSVATLVCPGRLLAATLKTQTLTHISSSHFSRNCCPCQLKPQCPDDKQSRPRGWSSARCPP